MTINNFWNITTASLAELKEDRAASWMDGETCRRLAILCVGEQKRQLQARADGNAKIVAAIDAELVRREEQRP